jgi:hypothetical protein
MLIVEPTDAAQVCRQKHFSVKHEVAAAVKEATVGRAQAAQSSLG